MTYKKRADLTALPGETVVELDDGDLVAVACPSERNIGSNQLTFTPSARWIDPLGVAQLDASGRTVTTTLTHQSSAEQVNALTSSVVVRECLYLVLGESLSADPDHEGLTLIPWSSDVVNQCSIRTAISAARVTAPVASDVL